MTYSFKMILGGMILVGELSYTLATLALMTSTVMAQGSDKPYRIRNATQGIISTQTKSGQNLPNLPSGKIQSVSAEDLPLLIHSGDSALITPDGALRIAEPNCHAIIPGDPRGTKVYELFKDQCQIYAHLLHPLLHLSDLKPAHG